ncbi:hypothetical protein CLF_110904 [Clonorchis sinensis]|uniref:Pol-related protein n=1 Tax=Clonorchis sinensis TaxID=79923 RepID=G7YL95_CLOSI|nr:hypothetical protein CLF_110904 [Clonorchis sinensis]
MPHTNGPNFAYYQASVQAFFSDTTSRGYMIKLKFHSVASGISDTFLDKLCTVVESEIFQLPKSVQTAFANLQHGLENALFATVGFNIPVVVKTDAPALLCLHPEVRFQNFRLAERPGSTRTILQYRRLFTTIIRVIYSYAQNTGSQIVQTEAHLPMQYEQQKGEQFYVTSTDSIFYKRSFTEIYTVIPSERIYIDAAQNGLTYNPVQSNESTTYIGKQLLTYGLELLVAGPIRRSATLSAVAGERLAVGCKLATNQSSDQAAFNICTVNQNREQPMPSQILIFLSLKDEGRSEPSGSTQTQPKVRSEDELAFRKMRNRCKSEIRQWNIRKQATILDLARKNRNVLFKYMRHRRRKKPSAFSLRDRDGEPTSDPIVKAFAVLRVIRRTFSRITRTDFQILYGAYVRPLLEYANPVVYSGRTKDVILIERVQRAATKMVAGLKSMDYETRLVVLDLFPLEYRRLRGDLILTYALFEQGLANRFFTVDPANTRRGHGERQLLNDKNKTDPGNLGESLAPVYQSVNPCTFQVNAIANQKEAYQPIIFGKLLWLVSAYAQVDCGSDGVKDTFYRQLYRFIRQARTSDIVIRAGDMSAKVGRLSSLESHQGGRFGVVLVAQTAGSDFSSCVLSITYF